MADADVLVALVATKAPWGIGVRTFIRDHSQGISAQVVTDRQDLAALFGRADVVVVDDVMRALSAGDIALAREHGARVIGISERAGGLGAAYLERLGVHEVLSGAIAPAEIVAAFVRAGKKAAVPTGGPEWPVWRPGSCIATSAAPLPSLSAWTKVSGGAGLTEVVVAAAQELSRTRRVLLVEADEGAPVLVSRLLRSPEGGLSWALSRAAQGLSGLPDGLSGARGDGARPVGSFDAVCAAPGAGQPAQAAHLERVLQEALACYDHVLVEVGVQGMPVAGRRPQSGARALALAGSVVVVAQADPEGAARLVNWRAAYLAEGAGAPCHAVFGRASRSRYEREHLLGLVAANTAGNPFETHRFLPEDAAVARARWNAELVGRGPWAGAVRDLAREVATAGSARRWQELRRRRQPAGRPQGAGQQ